MTGLSASAIEQLEQDLAKLAEASRQELVDLWNVAYGRPPPKGLSRRLLEYAAAYEMQAAAFGGLKPWVRRLLLSCLAPDSAERASTPARKLAPGTRLVREWNGRSHTVEVVAGGFVWNGKVHRSLSAAAYAITGARWSGPRFFGL